MKKSFLRILSITVTMLLIVGMVMIPANAAVPETGITVSSNSGASDSIEQITMYRASDAAEATDGAWLSSDSSVWKFAAGTLGDTFKPSSADFAAPTAESVKGGGIKLSWTAPADGKATVKAVADGYNKEVVTTANSITLNDTAIGKSYQIQVTVGDVSSQILAYNNIYTPITAKNHANDTNYITVDRLNADGEVTNQWGWTVFDVSDYTDFIGENAGFIFRVESIIDPEATFNFTHYYDLNNQTGISEWKEYETADEYFNSADSGIAFNTYIGMQETNVKDADGNAVNYKTFTANADTTRTVHRIDTTGMGVNTAVKTTNITNGSNMKNNFISGYIIVPFDVVASEGIETIKQYGKFSLTTEAFRYYPENTFQTTSAGGTSWIGTQAGQYQYTDIDTDKTGNIVVMQDREIFLGDAGFITDIDAFIATCTDISSAAAANVDFTNLASSSETKDAVYLNTQATSTVKSPQYLSYTQTTLSADEISSTYAVSNIENMSYTTAAGEKMMLGFTAPAEGIYDVSCPISVADYANKGVYTRVIKESADGTKTILQAEAAYDGGKHLAFLTAELAVGDTVWFEAWANSAATVIDLGIPQMTRMHRTSTLTGTQYYSWYTYFNSIISNDRATLDVAPVMTYGYFINNFEVDGVEYDYIKNTVYDAATTKTHDMLGLASLSATDDETTEIDETDATALYNALTPHEVGRGSKMKSRYDMYRYNSAGNFGLDNPTNGMNTSGIGITGTRQLQISYGMGTAFGGNLKSVYFDAGVYMQFTAPSDGVITELAPGNGDPLTGKGLVLHNSKVIAVATSKYNELTLKDITVNKGDTITVCYGTTDGTASGTKPVYDPRLTFVPAKAETATVSFDQTIDSIIPEAYNVGDTIKLPTVAKSGAIFQGWNDGTATYAAGEEYTINADTAFTAEYIYYGDLDGAEGIAQASDVSVLRKIIMGAAETGAADNASITGDIDANGIIDLIDLVKIKKMSADIDVTVGAK